MKRLITFVTLLSFSLITLFSFALTRPTTSLAADCSFTIKPDPNIISHGGFIVSLEGVKDHVYRIYYKSTTGLLLDQEDVTLSFNPGGGPDYYRFVDELAPGVPKKSGRFIVYVSEVTGGLSACGPASGIEITVGEAEPVVNPRFTEPPKTLPAPFTTIAYIEVVGLARDDADYKIKLDGKWDGGWLREKGGDDKFQENHGVILVSNICENGEGNRPYWDDSVDCEEAFQLGKYTLELVLASNEDDILTSYTFEVLETGGQFGDPIWDDPESPARKHIPTLLNFLIGIAGGVAFLLMIFGSYRLIFAGGNPESIQQGREVITAAIVGLIVVVFSVFILRFLGVAVLGIP